MRCLTIGELISLLEQVADKSVKVCYDLHNRPVTQGLTSLQTKLCLGLCADKEGTQLSTAELITTLKDAIGTTKHTYCRVDSPEQWVSVAYTVTVDTPIYASGTSTCDNVITDYHCTIIETRHEQSELCVGYAIKGDKV